MEESQNKDLQVAIKVQFEKYPLLPTLVKHPTHHLESPWTQLMSQRLHSAFGTPGEGAFYRIVFDPKQSGRDLMTIQKGPLAGLQTTTVVDGGKFVSVAGLKEVDFESSQLSVPMLLTMGALHSIHTQLSYISNIAADIRNRQVVGDQAKLERISEVIVDCFESMSEGDERINWENLRRVTDNTDDCYEILTTLREDLFAQHRQKQMDFYSFHEFAGVTMPDGTQNPTPTEAIRTLMRHNVFAAYERYAAGRACQLVLSANYSATNIGRHKRALGRVRESIRKVFDERMERHENGANFLGEIIQELKQGGSRGNWTVESAQEALDRQVGAIEELERELYALLDARVADFDALAKIFKRGKFQAIVIDGVMIFSESEVPALDSETGVSAEVLAVTDQIAR